MSVAKKLVYAFITNSISFTFIYKLGLFLISDLSNASAIDRMFWFPSIFLLDGLFIASIYYIYRAIEKHNSFILRTLLSLAGGSTLMHPVLLSFAMSYSSITGTVFELNSIHLASNISVSKLLLKAISAFVVQIIGFVVAYALLDYLKFNAKGKKAGGKRKNRRLTVGESMRKEHEDEDEDDQPQHPILKEENSQAVGGGEGKDHKEDFASKPKGVTFESHKQTSFKKADYQRFVGVMVYSAFTILLRPTCPWSALTKNLAISVYYQPIVPLFSLEKSEKQHDTVFKSKESRLSNIMMIVLESARSDMYPFDFETSEPNSAATFLNTQSKKKHITPFLENLAKEHWYSGNTIAVSSYGPKSLYSINCGVYPVPENFDIKGDIQNRGRLCLPSILKGKGYESTFIHATEDVNNDLERISKSAGFQNVFSGRNTKDVNELEDTDLLPHIKSSIEKSTGKDVPFFMEVLTSVNKYPWSIAKSWKQQDYSDHKIVDKVINSAAYIDNFISKVFDILKSADRIDDTIVLIVGSHGHTLVEHSQDFTAFEVPYESAFKVPMFLYHPQANIPKPSTKGRKFSTIDIMPTMLALLGDDVGKYTTDGEDVLATDFPQNRDLFSFSSPGYSNVVFRQGGSNLKWVYNTRSKSVGGFDLSVDPQEKVDICDSQQKQCQDGLERITNFIKKIK